MALLATSPRGLQAQLNSLTAEADRLALTINLGKTNIVVFRKGVRLKRCESWAYGNEQIAVVNTCMYLGLTFTSTLITPKAVSDFIPKAKRKIVSVLRVMCNIDCCDWNVFRKIFDSQIQPALLHASEVWGTTRIDVLERVHTFALKCFLSVSRNVPNTMVYGDTGRFPLLIRTYTSCVKFWLKLGGLSPDRLPSQAYRMSLTLAQQASHHGLAGLGTS